MLKIKLFKCLVNREIEYDTNEVYRTFEEFCELYQLLIKTFTTLKMPETVSLNIETNLLVSSL